MANQWIISLQEIYCQVEGCLSSKNHVIGGLGSHHLYMIHALNGQASNYWSSCLTLDAIPIFSSFYFTHYYLNFFLGYLFLKFWTCLKRHLNSSCSFIPFFFVFLLCGECTQFLVICTSLGWFHLYYCMHHMFHFQWPN